MATTVSCDRCKITLKGDNTDGFSGLIPLPSEPPTPAQIKANPKFQKPKYTMTRGNLCFQCVESVGDHIASK
jgi:hypothetical protein